MLDAEDTLTQKNPDMVFMIMKGYWLLVYTIIDKAIKNKKYTSVFNAS